MPTNTAKDEIFLMFERSVIPKLEIEERPLPKYLACAVASGKYGLSAMETANTLANDWGAKIRFFSWIRYYSDLVHILETAIVEEKSLEKRVKEIIEIQDITPVMSPDPTTILESISELTKKQGRSVDLFLRHLSEGVYDMLFLPVPIFSRDYDEEHSKETLGNEIEIILRKTSRTLPICLVPKHITGDENTVVVIVRPDIIAPLTSRIMQLFNENTKVVLLAVLDSKLIDLFHLMRSTNEDLDSSITKEEIEKQMEKKLQDFLEQMGATLRGKVKSTAIEIVKGGSLGLSTANIVDSHNASSILVYSRTTEEELLDPEVELLSRLVPQTKIFIVWN